MDIDMSHHYRRLARDLKSRVSPVLPLRPKALPAFLAYDVPIPSVDMSGLNFEPSDLPSVDVSTSFSYLNSTSGVTNRGQRVASLSLEAGEESR